MENTLFAYFENQLFPSPVQPQPVSYTHLTLPTNSRV